MEQKSWLILPLQWTVQHWWAWLQVSLTTTQNSICINPTGHSHSRGNKNVPCHPNLLHAKALAPRQAGGRLVSAWQCQRTHKMALQEARRQRGAAGSSGPNHSFCFLPSPSLPLSLPLFLSLSPSLSFSISYWQRALSKRMDQQWITVYFSVTDEGFKSPTQRPASLLCFHSISPFFALSLIIMSPSLVCLF